MSSTRTRHDIEFDIRYGMRCALLHAAVYGAVDKVLTLVQVIAMLGAVYTVIEASAAAATVVGALVAVSMAIQLVVRPHDKASRERVVGSEFAQLYAALEEMTDRDADKALRLMYRTQEPEIGILRRMAYNDVIDEMGLDAASKYPCSTGMKLIRQISG